MATYTLTVRYNANGGTITTNCGTAGVYKVTSGSTNYWYKLTSNLYYRSTTSATSGFSVLQSTQTATNGSSGTSKTRTINLINVATPNITKTGYHIIGTQAYGTTASGGVLINQDTTASTDTNAATVYRMLGNAYISANKTVTLYVHWIPNTYTVHYNANGGSGTMADGNSTATTWNYGTSYALRSNTFTKTGYTFLGWATSTGGSTSVFYIADEGPCTADHMGTNGTYIFLKDGSTFYRVSVDGSDSWVSIGGNEPSGVTWVEDGTNLEYHGSSYYFRHRYYDSSGRDTVNIYRVESGDVVYTDGQSVSNLTTTNGGEVTLYAVWMPEIYSIAYHLSSDGDGVGYWSSSALHPTLATFDYTFTISHPSDDWYDFHGWYITGMDSTIHTIGTDTSTSTWANNVLATNFKNLRATSGTVNFYAGWGRTFYFHSGIQEATSAEKDSDFYSSDDTGGYPEEWLTFPTGASISGWTFSGWRNDTLADVKQYNNSDYDIEGQSFNNNEFYAIYTRTLTLSFGKGNGGSGTGPTALTGTQYYNSAGNVSTVTFTLPSSTFTPPPGYSFADWENGSEHIYKGAGETYTWNPGVTDSNSYTLTARYKRTLYFRSGTGQGVVNSYEQYYGYSSITTPAVTAISGWSILGWRDDSTASTSEYAASSTVTYSGTATTFYGVYSRTLTQSYNANGGSGTAPAAKTATQYYNAYGNVSTATFAAQANTFTAPTGGWSFYVWSTDSSPTSGTTYTATASPTWAPAASSTTTSRTLYVRWQRTLYFESGISEAQENSTYQYRGGSTYTTVTFPTPAALSTSGTPWTALGWRTDTTAATNQYSAGSLTFKGYATRFNAIYERIVQISFSANGGTGTPPESVGDWQYYNSYGNLSSVILTIPANTFTRPGYTFSSWDIGSPGLSVAVHPALNDYSFLNSNAMWIPRIYIKQNGTWKESVPQIKVSGTWKTPTAMYVKVNGTWKQIY